jgi:hypothetical protein
MTATLLAQAQDFAAANPVGPPAPNMPSIVIGSDGEISPATSSISKTGNVYTLTGNITGYSINILCNGIVLDGAGYTLQSFIAGYTSGYAPNSGVSVSSEDVTVKNLNIRQYDDSDMRVSGVYNTITNCTMTPHFGCGINLEGSHNNITGNTIHGGINLSGNHNNIVRNLMVGHGVYMSGRGIGMDTGPAPNFNTIVANTIRDCPFAVFGVYLSTGTNLLFLNNFINNTNGNIAPYQWQLSQNGEPADQWTPGTTWRGIYPNNTLFDNGNVGNYWSDYNGTDGNGDGVGDEMYFIGGILQDNYPLMTPVDISSTTVPTYEWLPQSAPTPSPKPSPVPSTPSIFTDAPSTTQPEVSPTPTASESQHDSPTSSFSPSGKPTQWSSSHSGELPPETIYATAAMAVIVVIVVIATFMLRRRKH